MKTVSCYDVEKMALELAGMIAKGVSTPKNTHPKILLVPVPRGGVPVAWAIAAGLAKLQFSASVRVSDFPALADECAIVVDDILVTGTSLARAVGGRSQVHGAAILMAKGGPWHTGLPNHAALYVGEYVASDVWVQFPWEVNDDDAGQPEDAVRRLIEYWGLPIDSIDPKRVLALLDELRVTSYDSVEVTLCHEKDRSLRLRSSLHIEHGQNLPNIERLSQLVDVLDVGIHIENQQA